MASDPSIFAQANRPTVALQDPNTLMQGASQTVTAMYNNRLQQAAMARGQLMQQAVDPQTGQFNPAQFNRLMAASPQAALAAPESINQSQALATSQNDLLTKQNHFMSQALGATLKVPDGQLHDATVGALSRAADLGLITPQMAIKQAMMLPNDPGALRQHLTQAQMSLMGPDAQRTATYGTRGDQNTGGTLQSGVYAPVDGPNPGGFTPSTTTPLTIGPDAAAGQVSGVGPDGAPTAQPLAGRLQQQGMGAVLPPQAGGPPARGQLPTALLPPNYNGRYGSSAAAAMTGANAAPASTASSDSPTAAPAAGPGGAVVTGLPPGQAAEAEASVGHLGQARDAANTYMNRMQPLLSAQQALRDAKTGAGSETLNNVRQLVGNFTPSQLEGVRSFFNLGTDQGDAAFDEARKYLTNYAANTPGANRSDAGGATAANANANVHISPLAAQHVVQAAIGMERMKQAQTLEFNNQTVPGTQQPLPGSQYDRFQAGLAAKTDPRAFAVDMQTPDERKAMLDKMTAPQRTNFLASLRLGMKHGLVSLGG